jgi:hypothetical protein
VTSKPSRLRRALRRCAAGLAVVLLLVGLGTWWAHQHLTRLIVGSFHRTYPDLEMTAKAAALTGTGELNMKNVRIRARADGSDVLSVPSAKVRFSWSGIRTHYIQEITVEKPRITVSDKLLAAIPASKDSPGGDAPWRIGRIAINGGAARVNLASFPDTRFGFHLELTEGGDINELSLTGLSMRTRADKAEVFALPGFRVRASMDDLRQQKLREVVLLAPRLTITDQLLASFPSKASTPANPAPASTPAEPQWTVDALRLEGGHATIDLAAWPRTDFTVAAEVREKQPIGGTPGELTLSAVSVRSRKDNAELLNIASAKARVTLEGLQARKLGELTIESPHISVTESLLALFAGKASEPAAPQALPASTPATAASTPPAPSTPETPWTVGRVHLTGGKANVDLPGAPLVQLGFAGEMGDDLLPPRERDELQAAVDFTDIAVQARGARLEPFLRIPALRTKLRLPEIQRERRVAWVEVDGFDFRFNKVFRDFIESIQPSSTPAPAASTAAAPAPAKSTGPYTLGELIVTNGEIHLDDLGIGVPSIGCHVNTSFRNLRLAPDAGEGGQELQTIELSRLALTSPLDPFVSVLTLDTVFIRFTLAGIWQREIEEIAIVRPRLDIGPDLFWYVDRVQKKDDAAAAPAIAPRAEESGLDWKIHRFSATAGQLFLALEGHSEVALPMPFESHAENLNFKKLSDLRLKLVIDMPVQDYDYPGYELALKQVGGRVEFSLPPAQGANNVVNTLRLREVRWKQFTGRDFFLDVTYDEKGIYGNLGGKSYGGLLRGQFNFLISDDSQWNGWMSGSHVDLKPVTDALVPEKFSLTGPANFSLTVAARGSSIDQLMGDFKATQPGQLRIGKIDDLIKELPGDWSGVKRGLSRISLEALRDFAYDTGHGDFRFQGLNGALHLDFRGPTGGRKIEVNFHDGPEPPVRKGRRVATRQP